MSLKADLSERELPSVPFGVQKHDPAAAAAELQKAELLLFQAESQGDKAQVKRWKAAATRARKKVEACFTSFTIRALDPRAYEGLIEMHPPTKEQLDAAGEDPGERPEWNEDTFYPALLEACVDEDMTAEDWAVFLEHRMSRGERRQLKYALVALNENARMPESMILPKGSLGTGISLLSSM